MNNNSSSNLENVNQIEDISIFDDFIDKNINIETEECTFHGILRSVDGYLNSVLHNVEIYTRAEPKENIKLKTCFIRGVTIKYINIIKPQE